MNINARLLLVYAELLSNNTHVTKLHTTQAAWKPSTALDVRVVT